MVKSFLTRAVILGIVLFGSVPAKSARADLVLAGRTALDLPEQPWISKMAILSDGAIGLVGRTETNYGPAVYLARVNSDGSVSQARSKDFESVGDLQAIVLPDGALGALAEVEPFCMIYCPSPWVGILADGQVLPGSDEPGVGGTILEDTPASWTVATSLADSALLVVGNLGTTIWRRKVRRNGSVEALIPIELESEARLFDAVTVEDGRIFVLGFVELINEFGERSLVPDTHLDAIVLAFDPDGRHVFTRTFGRRGVVERPTRIEAAGNRLALGGSASTTESRRYDIWIAWIDRSGREIRKLARDADLANNKVLDLLGVDDGLLVLASTNIGGDDALWFFKLDFDGAIVWEEKSKLPEGAIFAIADTNTLVSLVRTGNGRFLDRMVRK